MSKNKSQSRSTMVSAALHAIEKSQTPTMWSVCGERACSDVAPLTLIASAPLGPTPRFTRGHAEGVDVAWNR